MIGGVFPVGFVGLPMRHTLADLILETRDHPGQPLTGKFGQRAMMDRVLVVKSREEQLQQILANLPDRARRRHVMGVAIVQASHFFVGSKQVGHIRVQRLIHKI